jgi:hypothetical protein
MAEYAERKLRTAKLSIALAIAAVIGGLAARDQTAQATATETGAKPPPSTGSITSAEVKNESLLFKDFKPGQIYSDNEVDNTFWKIADANNTFVKIDELQDKYWKIDDANNTFQKITDANNTFQKITDANNTFQKITDANATFLKIDDANSKYQKITDANNTFVKIADAAHQFMHGDGSVLTGFEASVDGEDVTVLQIPGLIRVDGQAPQQGLPTRASLTNLGTTPLPYVSGSQAGQIAVGDNVTVNLPGGANGGSTTVQLISPGASPTIATLTISMIPVVSSLDFSAQMLLGAGQ